MDHIDRLKSALYDMDLKMRPKALIIHPDTEPIVIDAIPDIENMVKIYKTTAVKKDEAIIMNRDMVEKFWR